MGDSKRYRPIDEDLERQLREEFQAEFINAGDRVGHTNHDRMQWLLKFASTDFRRLSIGDRCICRWTLLPFETLKRSND